MIIPHLLIKRIVLILLLLILLFAGLYFAGDFLKPIAVAILVTAIFLPLARKLERKGAGRYISSSLCIIIFVAVISGVGGIVAYQGKQFAQQYSELKSEVSKSFEKATKTVAGRFGLSQEEVVSRLKKNGFSNFKATLKNAALGVFASITDLLLIFVYVYIFLLYRAHFKKFLIHLLADYPEKKVVRVIEKSLNKAILYLQGKLILIGILAVIYSLGMLLMGVKFAVFYGILAAILSLIPFIGNIVGGGIPIIITLASGDTTKAMLVFGLFTLVQFIESYVLTPMVVGKEVNLHPVMTILIVVLGGVLWGVVGMMIAIPYLGMLIVVLQYIPKMKPLSYLLKDNT